MNEAEVQASTKTKELLGKLRVLKNLVIFHMNMPMCSEAKTLIEEMEKSLELSEEKKP
jgi:hypothetical protein